MSNLYLTVLETYREIAGEKGQTKNVAYIDDLIKKEKQQIKIKKEQRKIMENKKTQTMELSNQKLKKEEFAKNLLELIFGDLPDYDFDKLNEKLMKDNDFIVEALACLERTKTHSESLVKIVVKDGLSEVEVAKKFDLLSEEFFEAYNKEKKALRLPSSTSCLKKYLVK